MHAIIPVLVRGWKILVVQVRLLLLAALAGEHILYIGPPGTAKSELGRRLARLYKGSFFERLLTRFSVPEVVTLPVCGRPAACEAPLQKFCTATVLNMGIRVWCMHVSRCTSTARIDM